MSDTPERFEILQWPRDALLLRRKARLVRDDEFGTPELLAFVAALGQTMMDYRGLGLASTQVERHPGGEPWAVFVLRVNDGSWVACCNPAITGREGERIAQEGCLSFASVAEPMVAPEMVALGGFNTRGVPNTWVLEGDLARAAWHECQHLIGRTILDRMSPLKRRLFVKRVEKARRMRMDPPRVPGPAPR